MTQLIMTVFVEKPSSAKYMRVKYKDFHSIQNSKVTFLLSMSLTKTLIRCRVRFYQNTSPLKG